MAAYEFPECVLSTRSSPSPFSEAAIQNPAQSHCDVVIVLGSLFKLSRDDIDDVLGVLRDAIDEAGLTFVKPWQSDEINSRHW